MPPAPRDATRVGPGPSARIPPQQAGAELMRMLASIALPPEPTPPPKMRASPQGLMELLAWGASQPGMLPMGPIVYHGTPHKFAPTPKNPLGEFDLSKMGTGEGAQAYGHGVYLAGNPEVARSYQRGLTDWTIDTGSGPLRPQHGTPEDRALAWLASSVDAQSSAPFQHAKNAARSLLGKSSSRADEIAALLDRWQLEGAQVVRGGHTYKVNLPDEAAGRMLDWDAHLSDQPLPVKSSINEVRPVDWAGPNSRGSDYYNAMRGHGGDFNASGASKFFSERGIPGLKYWDQGSRAAGSGTRNYVVWEPSILDILGRE